MRPRQKARFQEKLRGLQRKFGGPSRGMRPSSPGRSMPSRGPGMGARGGPARPMSGRPQGSPSMTQRGPGGPGGDARKRAFKRRRKIHSPRRGLR